jgi:serine-type D-Ala-D-Ala carboxypeptidase/endopeptidase
MRPMRKIAGVLTVSRSSLSAIILAVVLDLVMWPATAQAKDKLLDELVDFAGTMQFLAAKVPAMVIGAVRNGETAVAGFGKIRDGSDRAPDGQSLVRIGSISKAFAGAVLASLAADGTVRFTDPLQKRLGWDVKIPQKDGKEIRLIDLVTHASGLPREVEREPGPADNPFQTMTKETLIKNLQGDPLLFAPGTGALYSNFAFDLLAQALANAAGKPYEDVLRERVLDPLRLTSTVFNLNAEQKNRVMQGHNFDGKALPEVPSVPMMFGSGGLYSTADDMLRWLAWHLDRFSTKDAEMRFLDHAAYLPRDGLSPVSGLDESGRMDAMGLGWVIMMPRGTRPLILQKAGALQGAFSYTAFAPTRGVGVFIAINAFELGAALQMAEAMNEFIATIAPR